MPKPKDEEYIRLATIAPMVYELTGVSRSPDTVKKWVLAGRISKHGVRIKLKHSKRLGLYYSTRKWLQEFIDEVG